MSTDVPELGGRYWDLQNYITGFAIAQMAAFLVSVATSPGMRDGVRDFREAVAIAIVASGVLYLVGVWFAFVAERRLCPMLFERGRKTRLVLYTTLVARLVTIAVVNGVGVAIVCCVIEK